MFAEAIEVLLRDQCTPEKVRAIEGGASPTPLWSAFADAGFLELMRPESEGGAELPLPELWPLLQAFGRHAMPLPLAQSIGARALVGPGIELPLEPMSFAPAIERDADGRLVCHRVPDGARADFVLAAEPSRLLLIDSRDARREPAGGSVATLIWEGAQPAWVVGDAARAKLLAPLGAAVHAAQMAGAMARVFEMSLQYCNDRQQFGRPLGKFQAVQHQLAVMAEHVAAVSIASEAAFEAPAHVPEPLRAAIAKARAREAVPLVADAAHALHGAIGVTAEYDLQIFTRRLREWRGAHGSEAHWNRVVGAALLASNQSASAFVRAI